MPAASPRHAYAFKSDLTPIGTLGVIALATSAIGSSFYLVILKQALAAALGPSPRLAAPHQPYSRIFRGPISFVSFVVQFLSPSRPTPFTSFADSSPRRVLR